MVIIHTNKNSWQQSTKPGNEKLLYLAVEGPIGVLVEISLKREVGVYLGMGVYL